MKLVDILFVLCMGAALSDHMEEESFKNVQNYIDTLPKEEQVCNVYQLTEISAIFVFSRQFVDVILSHYNKILLIFVMYLWSVP